MTNREAIQRLSVNKHDHLAVKSLHDNNAEVIRTAVIRYFGTGAVADKAESALMERMAESARSYEPQESPDEWLARCANTECDRLRNEAIHEKANKD
jgi:DNA-directed RNA polymerase specialized sigma24 family protein